MSNDPALMIYWDSAEKRFVPCTPAEDGAGGFRSGDQEGIDAPDMETE